MLNLPTEYLYKMRLLLQDEFDDFLSSYQNERSQGFRINPLKLSATEFAQRYSHLLEFDLQSVPWCSNGFYFPTELSVSKLSLYHAGLYYIQEPSAMSVVEMMDIRPGMKVLDLCAAPGGKTVQIAGKLSGQGVLVSNDNSLKRCRAVLKNIEMSGIENCIITNAEPNELSASFSGFFDRILVDAPCSGEGMFRKSPDLIKSYAEALQNITHIQSEILKEAAEMLVPGGLLIYSTCTFNRDENESVIERFLALNEDFSIVDPFIDHPQIQEFGFVRGYGIPALRIFPHRLQGEGHFVAILKKNERQNDARFVDSGSIEIFSQEAFAKSDPIFSGKSTKNKNAKSGSKKNSFTAQSEYLDILKKFQQEELSVTLEPTHLIFSGSSAYLECPHQRDISKIRILRNGLYLGDVKNGAFVPSPAFIMSRKKSDFRHTISFSADDVMLYKYLRCETITVDIADGIYVVCLDEHPLGLIKIRNGSGKNLYNPNWRLQ